METIELQTRMSDSSSQFTASFWLTFAGFWNTQQNMTIRNNSLFPKNNN